MLDSWNMKKILGVGSLVFIITMLFNATAHSGDKYKCAKKAAKAKTEFAETRLYWDCVNDKNAVFKTKKHSCAIDAAKAKSENAAVRLYWACVRN